MTVNNPTATELGLPATTEKIFPNERLIQRQAFEYYYYMGTERTLDKVAKKFNIGRRTVADWSTKFEWIDRIEARDVELSKMAVIETDHKVKETKKTLLGIIRHLIDEKAIRDENGVITGVEGLEIKSVKELRECIDTYRDVIGENVRVPGDPRGGSGVTVPVQVNLVIKKG